MREVKGIAGHKSWPLRLGGIVIQQGKDAVFLVIFSDFRRCVNACRPSGLVLSGMLFTSAEREVKDLRRSGLYQSYNFLTRLGMQSL